MPINLTKQTPANKIFEALNSYSDNSEVRYVGGCVRKIIKKQNVDDIDLATNLKPSEVAMIGDSTHDLIAAKKAGLYAIGVLTGVAKRSELELYADKILKSIKDLPIFLNS